MRTYEIEMEKATKDKEYFYVGVAHDPESKKRIVKFGTTNNLKRRKKEHQSKKNYYQFPLHDFEYINAVAVSHANTIRIESSVRNALRDMHKPDEMFIRNDRYILQHDESILLKVKIHTKTYEFFIPEG